MLEGQDLSEQIKSWIDEVIEDTVNVFTEDPSSADWDLEALTNAMAALYQTEITAAELREDLDEISREALIEEFQTDAGDEYQAKEEEFGPELMRELERFIVLQVVDVRWREHLESMEALREGIHLRAMAQKDPLVEYTQEGERIFADLGRAIRSEVVLHLFHAELAPEEAQQQLAQAQTAPGAIHYEHETVGGSRRDRRGARRRRSGRCAGRTGAGPPERARQDRPQRPVLVRQRQEVQEVPRRIARESCAFAR